MTALALSTDTYLVFEGADKLNASVCTGDMVHEIISQFDSPRVWRVTLDEFSRDVTDQFVDEPEDEWAGTSYDRAASAADRSYRERMEGIR
jgi:hypothetical protein